MPPSSPRLLARDPTTFLFSAAAWSAATACTLLAPGQAFAANPIYRAIRKLPVPEEVWGGLMLLIAALLLVGLVRASVVLRVLACVSAAALWVFWGTMLVLGGLCPDAADSRVLFSAGGAYGAFVGAYCAVCAAQWALHTHIPPPNGSPAPGTPERPEWESP